MLVGDLFVDWDCDGSMIKACANDGRSVVQHCLKDAELLDQLLSQRGRLCRKNVRFFRLPNIVRWFFCVTKITTIFH